jgi:release factor glutamine methyltransferase
MYIPSDDSFLLADAVKSYHGKRALEVGAGSCVVAGVLRINFPFVVACDINLGVLNYCRSRYPDLMLVCCDRAEVFAKKFDLIVANPPYLPGDTVKDEAVFGGPLGVEQTIMFAESIAPLISENGAMLLVASSLSDLSLLKEQLYCLKLKTRIVAEKRLFFETISVIEAKWK